MTYTLRRIGVLSSVRIATLVSAVASALPVALLVLLNDIFHFWDVIIPPDVLLPLLVQTALLGAVAGGLSTALGVLLYNVSAPLLGGISFELESQQPPRKQKEIEIR